MHFVVPVGFWDPHGYCILVTKCYKWVKIRKVGKGQLGGLFAPIAMALKRDVMMV